MGRSFHSKYFAWALENLPLHQALVTTSTGMRYADIICRSSRTASTHFILVSIVSIRARNHGHSVLDDNGI